jgi:hypothetical protein
VKYEHVKHVDWKDVCIVLYTLEILMGVSDGFATTNIKYYVRVMN